MTHLDDRVRERRHHPNVGDGDGENACGYVHESRLQLLMGVDASFPIFKTWYAFLLGLLCFYRY